jgi:hypothetical protein
LNLTFANDMASHPITFGTAAIMRDYMTTKEGTSMITGRPVQVQVQTNFFSFCYRCATTDT